MKKQMLSILEGNKTNLSSRQFVGRDLPHPLLLGQEEKQPCFTRDVEDPRTLRAARCTPPTSGMTGPFYHGTKAFTLIELLVVVLIIGILAAVAVPQYQKAVEKSRAVQALVVLKAVYDAAEAYYVANGTAPTTMEDLSVEIPWTGSENWASGEAHSNADWTVEFYTSSAGTPAVSVGRLRGKYQGAGFFIFLNETLSANIPAGVPVCAERTMYGGAKNFSAPAGSYCHDIFKGTLVLTSAARFYTLP